MLYLPGNMAPPLSRISFSSLPPGGLTGLDRPKATQAPSVSARGDRDPFGLVIEVMLTTVTELKSLAAQYAQSLEAFASLAREAQRLVAEVTGAYNQALAGSSQRAALSQPLWEACMHFLKTQYKQPIEFWFEDMSLGKGAFFSEHWDQQFSGPNLMILKNALSEYANQQTDAVSSLKSSLQLLQQTHNICTGNVKSVNDLKYQSEKPILKSTR